MEESDWKSPALPDAQPRGAAAGEGARGGRSGDGWTAEEVQDEVAQHQHQHQHEVSFGSDRLPGSLLAIAKVDSVAQGAKRRGGAPHAPRPFTSSPCASAAAAADRPRPHRAALPREGASGPFNATQVKAPAFSINLKKMIRDLMVATIKQLNTNHVIM